MLLAESLLAFIHILIIWSSSCSHSNSTVNNIWNRQWFQFLNTKKHFNSVYPYIFRKMLTLHMTLSGSMAYLIVDRNWRPHEGGRVLLIRTSTERLAQKSIPFNRLRVYTCKKVGISQIEVYEKGREIEVSLFCHKVNWAKNNNGFKFTSPLAFKKSRDLDVDCAVTIN